MREIKFRGRSHDNEGKIEGEWIYGFLAGPDQIMVWNENKATGQMFQVYPETIGQFTGIKDENGKGIYDGDTIEHKTAYDTYTGIVSWSKTQMKFVCHLGGGILNGALSEFVKVISDIPENPELLEAKPKC